MGEGGLERMFEFGQARSAKDALHALHRIGHRDIIDRDAVARPEIQAILRGLERRDRAALSRRLGTCDLLGGPVARRMKKIDYDGYRFPPAIIQQAVWLYFRFTLSFRDVEDLLAERGITVSYETVRRWVNHFGPMIAAELRKRRPKGIVTFAIFTRQSRGALIDRTQGNQWLGEFHVGTGALQIPLFLANVTMPF